MNLSFVLILLILFYLQIFRKILPINLLLFNVIYNFSKIFGLKILLISCISVVIL